MPSKAVLAKHGITDEKLKKLFTSATYPISAAGQIAGASDELARLIRRIRTRVQDGQANNFNGYKLYYAIDQAWDVPFKQVKETLLQTFDVDEYTTDVLDKAKAFGYTHLIYDITDDKTGKSTGKKGMNLPTFFKIFVPLVRAYVTIRAAKLTADRNLTPYFKFEPTRNTPLNRARCEVITDRIEVMATQMGYRDIGRQAILKTLLYGVQLMFPQEEWWKEEQENENGDTVIIREGLRYHLPHPTRTYWDQSHPLSSFNSDTGCEYAGYWRVRRFGDVRNNTNLWNTDKIAWHSSDLRNDNSIYFKTVLSGCTLSFPQSLTAWNSLDREQNIENRFYSSDFDDSAVVISEHFERLIPKKNGLGDYEHPVWFRFVVGGDGTILYAAPLPPQPVTFWGYDPEESRYIQTPMSLEVLPFQDEVSNLLSQALLSVRQNLANLTFVDSDIVDEKHLAEVENLGERWFRKLNFLRFSGRKSRTAQQDVRFAFGSVKFPQLDVPGILNTINAVLNVLERVLVMSAQEVAGQASHEQSAEEIQNIKQSTSTRLYYTAMQIDRAFDTWKRQLYTYLMAFGAEEIYSQLSNDPAYTPELLDGLGFTVVHRAESMQAKHLVHIKESKKALQLEYFSSTRDGNDRINNVTLAQAMIQMLTTTLSNPMMAQVIGPEQAIILMNQVLEEMGLPRDFKLRVIPQGMPPEQMQQWVQEQLVELTKQVKQFVEQGQQQAIKQISEQLQPLAEAVKAALGQGKANEESIKKIALILSEIPIHQPQPQMMPQTQTASNDTPPAQPTLTIGDPAVTGMAQ